jgi:hypothetical protein
VSIIRLTGLQVRGRAAARADSGSMSLAEPSRRARSLITAAALVTLLALPGTAAATVRPQVANIEVPTFLQQFDQTNATVGSLSRVAGGYGGGYAAQATYSGGGQNGYARGIFNVAWQSGDDVWYSGAYFLPVGFKAAMQGQVALMRWDDYGAHPEAADYSGVVIYGGDKRSRLVIDRIATSTQIELSQAFDLPEGRWFHLEVHQRLGSDSGLNEVYLDGTRITTSTQPNLEPGRGVDRVRYGIVAIASGSQTNPLTLQFDNATVSTTQTGPDPALAQPVTVPPADPPPAASKPVANPTPATPPPVAPVTPPTSVTPSTGIAPRAALPPTNISAPKRPTRLTARVRRCVRAAQKRAQRRGRTVSVASTVKRCLLKRR